MVIFSTEIFQGLVSGTTNVYTGAAFYELLGSVERVSVYALLTAVSGTSPKFTCQFENSPDRVRWVNQQSTPELNALSLALGDNTFEFMSGQNIPVQHHVRIRMALGGTSPATVLRMWVVGRSPAGDYP